MVDGSARKLVYGRHVVAALLERDPAGIKELWLQDGRDDAMIGRVVALAAHHGISLHAVPRTTLDRMLAGARHQGIAARYRATGASPTLDLDGLLAAVGDSALLLVLDGVQDPHNLGACLRSAHAAGADAVIVPRRRAVGLTPAVRKAACGAAERVPLVTVANLAQALRRMRGAGVRLFGAGANAGIPYTQGGPPGICSHRPGWRGWGPEASARRVLRPADPCSHAGRRGEPQRVGGGGTLPVRGPSSAGPGAGCRPAPRGPLSGPLARIAKARSIT